MMNRFYSVLLIFLIIPGLIQAQEIIDLEGALQIGLEQNYDVRVFRNEAMMARNQNIAGNAGMVPVFSLNGNTSYQRVSLNGTTFNDESLEAINNIINLQGNAQMVWTLFDGMGMFAIKDRLNETEYQSRFFEKLSMEVLIAEISKAYYAVIVEKERLKVFENNLKLSQERLDIAKDIYELGKGSKIDFLAAQVDFNADRSAIFTQQEALINSRIALNELLSRNVDTEFDVKDTVIDANLELKYGPLQEDVKQKNSQLLAERSNVNISAYNLKEVRAERYPRLELTANYGYTFNRADIGFFLINQNLGLTGLLNASIPIFTGNVINRRVQNAKISIDNAELRYDEMELALLADLSRFYTNYQNNIKLFELEKENFELARENADIAIERFRLGKSNYLQLREAQRNAVEAESRLIDAAYSTKVAEIELMRLSGNIISESSI